MKIDIYRHDSDHKYEAIMYIFRKNRLFHRKIRTSLPLQKDVVYDIVNHEMVSHCESDYDSIHLSRVPLSYSPLIPPRSISGLIGGLLTLIFCLGEDLSPLWVVTLSLLGMFIGRHCGTKRQEIIVTSCENLCEFSYDDPISSRELVIGEFYNPHE